MGRPLLPALVLAALLASPAALGWAGKGSYEPDTKHDITDGWMFRDADTSPLQSVERVYFDGFEGDAVGSASLNFATARSALDYGAQYSFYALFGAWKDCNKDGYIGLGDNAVLEYRAELLLDQSVCPRQSVPSPISTSWFPVHNDGNWIHEYIPIGWLDKSSPTGDVNPWNLNDNGARVWADYGAPGVEERPSLDCWITPQPRTTYHSVGGLLHTYDCFTGYEVTDNFDAVADRTPTTRPLSFSDASRDQYASGSALNARNPWGEESDGSFVDAWDCGKAQPVSISPTSADSVNVSAPRVPPRVATTGSVAGTLNATGSGFDHCTRDTSSGTAHDHPGRTLATLPYSTEGDVVDAGAKTQPDATMFPVELNRPATPYAALLGPGTPPGPGDGAGHGEFLDGDMGTGAIRGDGYWTESVTRTTMPLLDNADKPAKPQYVTYYGLVSSTAISTYGLLLPKGSTMGTYGVEACGTATSGVHAGWDCAASDWYKDTAGNDIEPKSHVYLGDAVGFGARPGAAYDARDVDCYDETIGAARSVGVSSGLLTSTPCDDAP